MREWSQLVTGVAMLISPFFGVFIWLSNRIGLGKAFAAFGIATVVILWIIIGAALVAKNLRR